MALPAALESLPEHVLPPELAGAQGSRRRISGVLFEQQRAANLAYCRTVSALYCLYRAVYGDAEDEYLALPSDAELTEFTSRKRELGRREKELSAQASVLLRVGPAATERALGEAVGFVERLPRVFVLVAKNVISVRAGQEALRRSRVLTRAQVRQFDDALADRLASDSRELMALPALRDAADRLVLTIDPAAAVRRRERAKADRTVTFRPDDDGMAAAFALLVAEDGRELGGRIEDIADTVCDRDSRTVPQRRADGLMMLVRGFVTLGCDCGTCDRSQARPVGDGVADGVIVRYRTLLNVVVNERTLADPENIESAYLVGHGPITAQHARDLAARDDAVVREFGERIPAVASETSDAAASETSDAAASETIDPAAPTEAPLVTARSSGGYRLTADLARYLSLVYPRCVFPLCTRPAHRCEIDHSREYDHADPAAGGTTTADNLQPLCTAHHQLKTAGEWIDTRLEGGRILWTGPAGAHFVVDPAGIASELFPDLARVRWTAPPVPNSPPVPESSPLPDSSPVSDSSPVPESAPRTRSAPSRIQREHARRQLIRQRNLARQEALRRPSPERTPKWRSIVEDQLVALIAARRRATPTEAARPALPVGREYRERRRPEPEHPDDPAPPF